MKILTLILLLLLMIPAIQAETITIEVELPENPMGQFSPDHMGLLMTAYARALEDGVNDQRTQRYGATDPATGACGNWMKNYDGNGICDYLPLPPFRLNAQAVRFPVGWGLSISESNEPLTGICRLEPDWLADLSLSCREKLGIAEPPSPLPGNVEVGACWPWYGNICQAGPGDTVAHGGMVSGNNFPDGFPRYKFIRPGMGNGAAWYQPEKP